MLLKRPFIAWPPALRRRVSLLAVIAIPLGSGEGWHALEFSDIPQNRVRYSKEGLAIEVNRSSSPLFYKFTRPLRVSRLSVQGKLGGFPILADGVEEGSKKGDDFALRVGLVLAGEKRLGWLERLFAPGWIKRLEELSDQAFHRVWFLSVAQTLPVGFKRTHPQSEYLLEEVGLSTGKPGPFSLNHTFEVAPVALGVWLQADGDDTQSRFTTTLIGLTVETPSPPQLRSN